MKPTVNLDEPVGKVVGRRQPPASGLTASPAQTAASARAWSRVGRKLSIPKGVYRFKTHEEADQWLWEKMTRSKT